jgi:hypothetical protein
LSSGNQALTDARLCGLISPSTAFSRLAKVPFGKSLAKKASKRAFMFFSFSGAVFLPQDSGVVHRPSPIRWIHLPIRIQRLHLIEFLVGHAHLGKYK